MLCRLTVLLHEAMCEGAHPQASFVDHCDPSRLFCSCLALRCRGLALIRTTKTQQLASRKTLAIIIFANPCASGRDAEFQSLAYTFYQGNSLGVKSTPV